MPVSYLRLRVMSYMRCSCSIPFIRVKKEHYFCQKSQHEIKSCVWGLRQFKNLAVVKLNSLQELRHYVNIYHFKELDCKDNCFFWIKIIFLIYIHKYWKLILYCHFCRWKNCQSVIFLKDYIMYFWKKVHTYIRYVLCKKINRIFRKNPVKNVFTIPATGDCK